MSIVQPTRVECAAAPMVVMKVAAERFRDMKHCVP